MKGIKLGISLVVGVLLYWFILLGPIGAIHGSLENLQTWLWANLPYVFHIVLGIGIYFILPLGNLKRFIVVFSIPYLSRFIALMIFAKTNIIDGESIAWYVIISTAASGSMLIGAVIGWAIKGQILSRSPEQKESDSIDP